MFLLIQRFTLRQFLVPLIIDEMDHVIRNLNDSMINDNNT